MDVTELTARLITGCRILAEQNIVDPDSATNRRRSCAGTATWWSEVM